LRCRPIYTHTIKGVRKNAKSHSGRKEEAGREQQGVENAPKQKMVRK
jgi:hypothetical protein